MNVSLHEKGMDDENSADLFLNESEVSPARNSHHSIISKHSSQNLNPNFITDLKRIEEQPRGHILSTLYRCKKSNKKRLLYSSLKIIGLRDSVLKSTNSNGVGEDSFEKSSEMFELRNLKKNQEHKSKENMECESSTQEDQYFPFIVNTLYCFNSENTLNAKSSNIPTSNEQTPRKINDDPNENLQPPVSCLPFCNTRKKKGTTKPDDTEHDKNQSKGKGVNPGVNKAGEKSSSKTDQQLKAGSQSPREKGRLDDHNEKEGTDDERTPKNSEDMQDSEMKASIVLHRLRQLKKMRQSQIDGNKESQKATDQKSMPSPRDIGTARMEGKSGFESSTPNFNSPGKEKINKQKNLDQNALKPTNAAERSTKTEPALEKSGDKTRSTLKKTPRKDLEPRTGDLEKPALGKTNDNPDTAHNEKEETDDKRASKGSEDKQDSEMKASNVLHSAALSQLRKMKRSQIDENKENQKASDQKTVPYAVENSTKTELVLEKPGDKTPSTVKKTPKKDPEPRSEDDEKEKGVVGEGTDDERTHGDKDDIEMKASNVLHRLRQLRQMKQSQLEPSIPKPLETKKTQKLEQKKKVEPSTSQLPATPEKVEEKDNALESPRTTGIDERATIKSIVVPEDDRSLSSFLITIKRLKEDGGTTSSVDGKTSKVVSPEESVAEMSDDANFSNNAMFCEPYNHDIVQEKLRDQIKLLRDEGFYTDSEFDDMDDEIYETVMSYGTLPSMKLSISSETSITSNTSYVSITSSSSNVVKDFWTVLRRSRNASELKMKPFKLLKKKTERREYGTGKTTTIGEAQYVDYKQVVYDLNLPCKTKVSNEEVECTLLMNFDPERRAMSDDRCFRLHKKPERGVQIEIPKGEQELSVFVYETNSDPEGPVITDQKIRRKLKVCLKVASIYHNAISVRRGRLIIHLSRNAPASVTGFLRQLAEAVVNRRINSNDRINAFLNRLHTMALADRKVLKKDLGDKPELDNFRLLSRLKTKVFSEFYRRVGYWELTGGGKEVSPKHLLLIRHMPRLYKTGLFPFIDFISEAIAHSQIRTLDQLEVALIRFLVCTEGSITRSEFNTFCDFGLKKKCN